MASCVHSRDAALPVSLAQEKAIILIEGCRKSTHGRERLLVEVGGAPGFVASAPDLLERFSHPVDVGPPQANRPESHGRRLPGFEDLRVDNLNRNLERAHFIEDAIAVGNVCRLQPERVPLWEASGYQWSGCGAI